MPQDDRIMSYFRGEMTAEEETAFLEEVKNDNALRENVVAIARIAKGMKNMGERMDDEIQRALLATSPSNLKTLLEQIDGKEDVETYMRRTAGQPKYCMVKEGNFYTPSTSETTTKKSSSRALIYISSIAASILLVFGGFKYKSYYDTTSLGTQYAMVFDESLLTRGGDNANVEKELKRLFSNVIEKKNSDETIKRLSMIWELSTMDVYNDYTDYSQEIGWNLTIAYLKDNDKYEAKQVLEQLAANIDHDSAFGNRVIELLEKVNDL